MCSSDLDEFAAGHHDVALSGPTFRAQHTPRLRLRDGVDWQLVAGLRHVVEWAARGEELGAGEILLTSMDCDGTKNGFDCELTRAVSRAVKIPVIASGGAGNPEHFADVLTNGEADAALAASIFHYGEIRISDLKGHLKAKGIPVRM